MAADNAAHGAVQGPGGAGRKDGRASHLVRLVSTRLRRQLVKVFSFWRGRGGRPCPVAGSVCVGVGRGRTGDVVVDGDGRLGFLFFFFYSLESSVGTGWTRDAPPSPPISICSAKTRAFAAVRGRHFLWIKGSAAQDFYVQQPAAVRACRAPASRDHRAEPRKTSPLTRASR